MSAEQPRWSRGPAAEPRLRRLSTPQLVRILHRRVSPRAASVSRRRAARPACPSRAWAQDCGCSNSCFATYLARGLIEPQAEECGMAQTMVGRPLCEADLRHELGARPLHLAHLLRGDATTPVSGARIGEVRERTCGDGQRLQSLDHLATDVWSEARAHLAGKLQSPSFVVTDEQRVQARGALRPIATDH